MKVFFILVMACSFSSFSAQAQIGEPEIDSWVFNENGLMAIYIEHGNAGPTSINIVTMTDSANILQLCYDTDFVWIRAEGLGDTMGVLKTPSTPIAQDFTKKFPRIPVPATPGNQVQTKGMIGLLVNGVAIDSRGNNSSYNNLNIWNGDVGATELSSLDERFNGHAAADSRYHTHATPYYLDLTSSSEHSNLVGFAYDGYPIYGPKGYSSPLDTNSSITRMISGYELRNISVRDSLPEANGKLTNPGDWGPVVDATYPLGTYSEDYAFTTVGATLDEYNGRFCQTPEYPKGTYAYFCTEDVAGTPIYPYMIGSVYYGQPESSNIGPTSNVTMPSNGCITQHSGLSSIEKSFVLGNVKLYPNPSNGILNIELANVTDNVTEVSLYNALGSVVFQKTFNNEPKLSIDTEAYNKGSYILQISSNNQVYTSRVIIQ